MKVFIAPHKGEIGKFRGIVQAFPNIWCGSILDVGCRSGKLKDVISDEEVHYVGLDLSPPADVIADLGRGLPFEDMAFDVVCALDVLEHTDNIYKSFCELCRVTKKYVVVSLPNVYEIRFRLRFLFGQRLSGKYGLPVEEPPDRHRWFFSLNEAGAFVHHWAHQCGFGIEAEGAFIGPRRALVKTFVKMFPNLFAPTYMALLMRVSYDK